MKVSRETFMIKSRNEMLKKIKQSWRNLKSFYKASYENRIQIHLFLGFMVLPLLGLSLLFIYVFNYLI